MAEGNVSNPFVWEFSRGGVPRDLHLMGALGNLPLKPEHLVELWTDLAHGSDQVVRVLVQRSLARFPADEVRRILAGPEPPIPVLWWAVSHRPEPELRKLALRDTALPQETIDALAPGLPRALAELAIVNHGRLLRRTSLLLLRRLRQALIGDAPSSRPDQAREASPAEDAVRRAATLLERAHVERAQRAGTPEHHQLIQDAIELLERALGESRDERRFDGQLLLALACTEDPERARRAEQVLIEASRDNPGSPAPFALLSTMYAEHGLRARAHSMQRRAIELCTQSRKGARDEDLTTEGEAFAWYRSEEERRRTELVSAVQRLYRLGTAGKVIAALDGTIQERAVLVRDPDSLVAAAVLGSPRITESEIAAIAEQENVSTRILEYIGAHPGWAANLGIATRLVMNARTPVATSLALLAGLDPGDLQTIARAQNLPEVVRARARELTATGSSSGSTQKERQALMRRVDALVATTVRSADTSDSPTPPHAAEDAIKAIEKAAETLRAKDQSPDQPDELEGLFVLTRHEQETLLELAGLSGRRAHRQALASPRRWIAHAEHVPVAALDLHEALVRARLRTDLCGGCGASLRSAALIRRSARFDATSERERLSPQQVAVFLAATDDLLVTCDRCHAEHEALAGAHGCGSQRIATPPHH